MNKNLILILSRKQTEYTDKLNNFFRTNHVDSILIEDNNDPPQSFLIDEGYHNMTKILDRPSAWEKSLYFIFVNDLYRKYDYFYFIEDDVYSKDLNVFLRLISLWNTIDYDLIARAIKDQTEEPEWFWWKKTVKDRENFKCSVKSFNPICRLSSRLIVKIHQYKEYYNSLVFHEILFPSVAKDFNMKYLDYDNTEYGKHIEIVVAPDCKILNYEDIITDNIYHPYKIHRFH